MRCRWYSVGTRSLCATFLALSAVCAQASRTILVPLDDRPAAGQFAQMIAEIAAETVQMPPYEYLGRFTRPGDPEAILDWIEKQDLSGTSALVVSADMIAYGGLIASRAADTPESKALERLKRFEAILRKRPAGTRVYVFSSVMRLAPTATRNSRGWRDKLGKYVGYKEQYDRTRDSATLKALANLRLVIPDGEIERYYATRQRDHNIQRELVKMTARSFDYLVLGQDDAQPFGPHIPETKALRQLVDDLHIGGKAYFCEGIDQISNVLVCRAMLKSAGWTPRVRVVYSDPYGRKKIPIYESKTVQDTVRDQILASGARMTADSKDADYALYVNTPDRRRTQFFGFVDELRNDLDQDVPVCLADINLGKDGTCDQELFSLLNDEGRLMNLLAFAGWNTPGNTLGTAIPTANLLLLARKQQTDALRREVAHKTFMLHRYVDDVLYHRNTRPRAYGLIDKMYGGAREEAYGDSYRAVDAFVRKDMLRQLDEMFKRQLEGKKVETPVGHYVLTGVRNAKCFLPWPRAYEVRLEFGIDAEPLNSTTTPVQTATR
jgi:hypothetical protein